MTKVEESREKAKIKNEFKSGYRYVFQESELQAFEQAIREEERDKHTRIENEWIELLLSNVSNPDGAGSYLVDALEKTMEDNSRFLTQPTKEK